MTPERKKTILIITGTLILGILIGVLGTGMVARQHYRGDRGLRGKEMGKGSRKGFARKLMHIIGTDSSKTPQLKPIIEETMDKIDAIQSRSRKEVQQVIDSMEVKLQPILTAEQLERLKKFHREKRAEPKPDDRHKPDDEKRPD